MSLRRDLDLSERVRRLRARLGLTQQRMAELMGVSFQTLNRWENGQVRPSPLAWKQIVRAEQDGVDALGHEPAAGILGLAEPIASPYGQPKASPQKIDFSTNADVVRVVTEAERLTYGHIFNPAFATEISLVEPLPHQRIAVYKHLLPLPRIRFLLADDPGAGKTIMSGLLLREMLSRRFVKRVLVVPPAGLIGNWEQQMRTLFRLPFRIVTGSDARTRNPFVGDESNLLILSVDTLAGERMFARLQEPDVDPYDMVIFDEAHKLGADRNADFTLRRTERYRLAEALCGVLGEEERWSLPWSCHHALLLTATPHMGRDYPYYALWRLLDPDVFATIDAFNSYPREARKRFYIRRTKEEMVRFDKTRIYPTRESNTLGCALSQGRNSEQELYDETTDYIQTHYNRSRILNRSAARLAMSVFQRRLASSTYALTRSFERRLGKLDVLIADIRSGKMTEQDLEARQRKLGDGLPDPIDAKTADEEEGGDGEEENEVVQDRALGGVVAVSLAELEAERQQVRGLLDLAKRVADGVEDTKFDKLLEVVRGPKFRGEKLLIFTEHRDTLDFLVRRLEGLGFTGQIARIHGGMPYTDRQTEVDQFSRAASEGGATFMVCTDAAAEGINLQFCWLMVNYDVPWNPARLEQRMGRIHRYGQKHDPVHIVNLVADKTREGRVLKTLLDKLERIRKELGSDKVFDVVGQLFEGVTLAEYMERVVTGEGNVDADIEEVVTKEKVLAIRAREKELFGEGGEVVDQIPELANALQFEELRRLLPGFVRRFVEKAAPLVGIGIDGDLGALFQFKADRRFALDPLLPVLEKYPEEQRQHLSVYKLETTKQFIFLHPGEPVFDRLRDWIVHKFGDQALAGGVFVDPYATAPYFFHLALVNVVRQPDPAFTTMAGSETVESRLVGVRQADGRIEECPVEQLLVLRGGEGVPAALRTFAATAGEARDRAQAFAVERIAQPIADERRLALVQMMPDRESYIRRGFEFQESDLAAARSKLTEKARAGDAKAQGDLTRVKERQKQLNARRDASLAALHREPELVAPGELTFVAHALVIPSTDIEDRKKFDAEVEAIAVRLAIAHEEALGRTARDVSTPQRAREAGLRDWPGFDVLSQKAGTEDKGIEVKGRARVGDVDVSENEWARACNLRDKYWLYVVFNCATPEPRLHKVRDPFGCLLAGPRSGVIVPHEQIIANAEKL
jgi:superfamily II DNA or RNA helicase/DNA-binding XRE family transcriptional regulator